MRRFLPVLLALTAACPSPAAAASTKPPDKRPPQLVSAEVRGATVTLRFDERLRPGVHVGEARVHANRIRVRVTRARVAGRAVVLTLGTAVWRDDAVAVRAPAVRDLAGNRRGPRTVEPRNRSAPGCAPILEPLVSPDPFALHEGPTDFETWLRPLGEVPATVVFVDFPDAPGDETPEQAYDAYLPRAAEWFARVSYGRMILAPRPALRWIRMARPSGAYGLRRGAHAEYEAFIREVIATADPLVDFSGNRLVYVIASRGADATNSPALTMRAGHAPVADGTPILHATAMLADSRSPARDWGAYTLVHETNHFFGLPDLYAYGAAEWPHVTAAVGGWDLMSTYLPGTGLVGWHRWKNGWLHPSRIRCVRAGTRDVLLTPLESWAEGVKLVVVQLDASRAIVAEVRRRIGEDRRQCHEGVLVMHVDATRPNGRNPVAVEAAEPTPVWEAASCGQLARAPFGLGEGKNPTYRGARVRIDVVSEGDEGSYSVRVARRP